jgi:hypothetical protein
VPKRIGWLARESPGVNLLDGCAHRALGFGLTNSDHWNVAGAPDIGTLRIVVVPDWFLFALFMVLAACYWLRRTKRLAVRRARLGLCVKCRYDLRATPDRCPECGAVPDKPSKAST